MAGESDQACHPGNVRTRRIILSNLNKHQHTSAGLQGCSSGIRAERLAYLAISDLLSGPECRMTARESPERLETCPHLCISHINKFSHRCIQTSLSALLHTTHSCHKHSETQSTTTGREKEKRKQRGGKKEGKVNGEKGSPVEKRE